MIALQLLVERPAASVSMQSCSAPLWDVLRRWVSPQNGLPRSSVIVNLRVRTISGWWFQPTPLKNIVRQLGVIIPFPIWMESHNPFSKLQNWKNDGWIFTNSSLSSGPLDIRVAVWKMIPPAVSPVILQKQNGLKSGWWWEKPQKNLRICERYLELSSQVIRKRKYRMVIET